MNSKAMYSSNSSEWETPQDLFDRLNSEFHFTLDAAATAENAKCTRFFDIEIDGLKQFWDGDAVWCNPPYGRDVWKWVKRAFDTHWVNDNTIVMLLPARTDTRWFHRYIYGKAEIRFLRGRLKFSGSKNSAPFPSMIVIFRGDSK